MRKTKELFGDFVEFLDFLRYPDGQGKISRVRTKHKITEKSVEQKYQEVTEEIRSGERDIEEALTTVNKLMDDYRRYYGELFHYVLLGLEGKSWATFEKNQLITKRIQQTADRLEGLFKCPTCGELAKIRCKQPGRSKSGVFQFEHNANGKTTTHGGGSTLPKLDLHFRQ